MTTTRWLTFLNYPVVCPLCVSWSISAAYLKSTTWISLVFLLTEYVHVFWQWQWHRGKCVRFRCLNFKVQDHSRIKYATCIYALAYGGIHYWTITHRKQQKIVKVILPNIRWPISLLTLYAT